MAGILTSLHNTVIAGFVLAALLLLCSSVPVARWITRLHVPSAGYMCSAVLYRSAFSGISILSKSQYGKHSGRSKASDQQGNRARRLMVVPVGCNGHSCDRSNSCPHEWLSPRCHFAWRFRRGEAYDDRYRYVAWSNYVFQRVVHYLAKSENSSRHCRCGSGRQSGFGAKSHAFLPNQYVALDTNAICHGSSTEHLLIKKVVTTKGGASAPPFFMPKLSIQSRATSPAATRRPSAARML